MRLITQENFIEFILRQNVETWNKIKWPDEMSKLNSVPILGLCSLVFVDLWVGKHDCLLSALFHLFYSSNCLYITSEHLRYITAITRVYRLGPEMISAN
jgi:hypothetical protein